MNFDYSKINVEEQEILLKGDQSNIFMAMPTSV
jgi:hypothetical protein